MPKKCGRIALGRAFSLRLAQVIYLLAKAESLFSSDDQDGTDDLIMLIKAIPDSRYRRGVATRSRSC